MRRIFVATVLASSTLSAPAFGDDIKGALKEFGLLGTWSPNCSKAISDPGGSKLSFAAPGEGSATATIQENKGEALVTAVHEVLESSIIDSKKIRIALRAATVTRSDGKAASQHEYDGVRLVFQKVGTRIEIIRVQFEGLPQIERASFFEKCPN
ncbi:hypothetical protein Q3C01_30775 [Bradyrhizobium sp. UFLA05-109]